MNNTPDSPAKPPDDRTDQGGNYWALFTPGNLESFARCFAALAWTRRTMTRLGLTVNETKTAVRNARHEHFDFLGYSFGPHYYLKDRHWYLGASPSPKSVQCLKDARGGDHVPRQSRALG